MVSVAESMLKLFDGKIFGEIIRRRRRRLKNRRTRCTAFTLIIIITKSSKIKKRSRYKKMYLSCSKGARRSLKTFLVPL